MHKIAMTGGSGFVGSHLARAFEAMGWDAREIARDDISSGPENLAKKIGDADVLVNLAGAPIIKRWTEGYKKIMYQSRVDLTRTLVEAVALMKNKPSVLISTSAVGYYSSSGIHDEYSYEQADGFLGRMAHDWEQEAMRANLSGVRTVIFRFGIVLGRGGGALKQMLLPFRLGIGGTVGDGSQAFSWVHTEDLIRAFIMAIEVDSVTGIYNLCAPEPSTNRALTKALAKTLGRPAFLRIPEFVLRLQYGQAADVLTKGQSVYPKRLTEAGFRFIFSDLQEAVRDCVT